LKSHYQQYYSNGLVCPEKIMRNSLWFPLFAGFPKSIIIGFESTNSLPFWIKLVDFIKWSTLLSRFKSMLKYDSFFASNYERPFISTRRFELRSIFVRLGNFTFLRDLKFVILFCQRESSSNDSAFIVYNWWREYILFPPRLNFLREPKLA
jgi:hypothetical protein